MTALDRPHPEVPPARRRLAPAIWGVHRVTGADLPAFRERARAIQARLIARGVMVWPAGDVPEPQP